MERKHPAPSGSWPSAKCLPAKQEPYQDINMDTDIMDDVVKVNSEYLFNIQ